MRKGLDFFKEEHLQNLEQGKAYKKAERVIKDNEVQINDFRKLYGDDNIDRDEKYVAEMEEEFKKGSSLESKKINELATVLEAIIFEQSEQNEWLGSDAQTIKTSRYDDIKNGVDMIVEFIQEDESAAHLGMAIDATFNSDTEAKFKRIKAEIDEGKLAEVKYFESDNIHFKGKLKMLPRIVVGADFKTVSELSELWLEGNNKALAEHQIQFQVLEEIIMQLRAFKTYAEGAGQQKITGVYKRALNIILPVYREKAKKMKDNRERDSVFLDIEKNLEMFK